MSNGFQSVTCQYYDECLHFTINTDSDQSKPALSHGREEKVVAVMVDPPIRAQSGCYANRK